METQSKSFSNFTNLYELSKTLRFELKPVGDTLEKMKQNLKYDKNLQTFLKDQDIEDAYQNLKPLIDGIHEEFINDSLESNKAKEIDFSNYLEKYKKKEDDKWEKDLYKKIGETYEIWEQKIKEKAGTEIKRKKWKEEEESLLKEKWFKCLTEKNILKYIKRQYPEDKKIQNSLEKFSSFFTYFSWFNDNRENYYKTEWKKWSIATRIIDENLPKFCDNNIQFFWYLKKDKIWYLKKDKNWKEIEFFRKYEYLNAYQYLKNNNKNTQIKDTEKWEYIEAYSIDEKYFEINYFNSCLSQKQIEDYNKTIWHYNLLINLYNQAKKSEDKADKFKNLPKFKTLFKQIWCWKKDILFFSLKYDKKSEIKEDDRKLWNEVLSVQELLEIASNTWKKYFDESKEDNDITIFYFINWLNQDKEDWKWIYWSNKAINTISNKYFANWHSIYEIIEKSPWNYKTVVTFDKKREQSIKLRDAVELDWFFEILNKSVEGIDNWQESFFKNSLLNLEKENENFEKWIIIKESSSPSKALIGLLCFDLKKYSERFISESESILKIYDYKTEENKKKIKSWMDNALILNQIIKYFLVSEKKIKWENINSELTDILDKLLKWYKPGEVDWFKWYDWLRNYLTKKAKDDVQRNKLKLNFECSSLLWGWSDWQEKIKKAVILKKDSIFYLWILNKSSIFDTWKEDNTIYSETQTDSWRLILANLKFQTLAWKGFLWKFWESYWDVWKKNSLKAIENLQEIIKERYVKKYPLLKEISNKKYSNKKYFDEDIQETLKRCYVCEFTPIIWDKVIKEVYEWNLYLFELSNKSRNIQNIYWNSLFLNDSPNQLNWGAEIFYRKKGIKEKKVKEWYENKPWVIKWKRFTSNELLENSKSNLEQDWKSFFFHCPMKINYKAKWNSNPKSALSENNRLVNDNFSNQETDFLGLDRWEKNLIYYYLLNSSWERLDQWKLNLDFKDKNWNKRCIKKTKQISNKIGKKWGEMEVECWNYNDLLDVASSNRDEARKNWQTIWNIKNLKEGYISQVIHEIVKKIINKPTFVVLEDLNTWFKRSRQKIEKQIYQKFELNLAKKLNFIVDKSLENWELGSVIKALQLTLLYLIIRI